jgi:hypothetical protein
MLFFCTVSVNPVYSGSPCQQASSSIPSKVGGAVVSCTVITGWAAAAQHKPSIAVMIINFKYDTAFLLFISTVRWF